MFIRFWFTMTKFFFKNAGSPLNTDQNNTQSYIWNKLINEVKHPATSRILNKINKNSNKTYAPSVSQVRVGMGSILFEDWVSMLSPICCASEILLGTMCWSIY